MFKNWLLLPLLLALVACPQPVPAPVIDSFSATPTLLPAGGGTVTLAWSQTSATSLSIDQGVGTVTGASKDVTVTTSTTFTLSASNATGSATKSVAVSVAPPATPPGPPPQPTTLAGTLEGWASTSRGARTLQLAWYDYANAKSRSLGQGTIDAQGMFALDLPSAAAIPASALNNYRLRSGCTSGVTVSPAALQSVASYPAVFSNDLSTEYGYINLATPDFDVYPYSAGTKWVFYVFADRDATVKGSCAAAQGTSATYDLTLKQGWNIVLLEWLSDKPIVVKYSSGPVPSDLKWRYGADGYKAVLSPVATALEIGKSYTLSAIELDGTPVTGQNIAWNSSNLAVASVDAKGLITTKTYGQVQFSAQLRGNGAFTPVLNVYGLEASAGTFNVIGATNLGTAFALRYTGLDGLAPGSALPVSVTGPNGWNGGVPLNLSYPAAKTGFWATSQAAPIAGSYTITIGSGATALSNTVTIDPTSTLGPAQNVSLTNYSTSSVTATWGSPSTYPPGTSPSIFGELVDKTSNLIVGAPTPSASWGGLSLDPTHDNELRVTTLSGDPGLSYYALARPFNVSRTSVPIDFTPSVTKLSFGGGGSGGGMQITLTGRNFTNGVVVKFGTTAATSVTVNGTTSLDAIVPAHAAGIVDVNVATNVGTSAASSATKFQYFTVNEFDITTPVNSSARLSRGGDGNVWFADNIAPYTVSKITPSGTITSYTLPTNSFVSDLALGSDNNVWYTSDAKIVKITPSGSITEYSLPTAFGSASMITGGPDGKIWITSGSTNQIAKIGTDGTGFTAYAMAIGGGLNSAGDLTTGADGNLWFTDINGARIGKVTPAGVSTIFTVPSGACCGPTVGGITVGPGGNIWLTFSNKLGRVASDGTITEFPLTDGPGPGFRLASGADGNLWFNSLTVVGPSTALGRMTPAGAAMTVLVAVPTSGTYGGISDVISASGKIWYARPGKIGVLTP